MRFRQLVFVIAISLMGIAGCGDDRPTRVPVSGTVMIDDQPLTYGFIRVIPEKGRLATAKLDSQGRFALMTYEQGDGVVLGTHSVEVIGEEALSETRSKWHAPKKYGRKHSSGLTATIDGPTDNLRIDITWSGGEPFIEIHN